MPAATVLKKGPLRLPNERPRIDRRAGPLYLSLAGAIAGDIQYGRLTAGDRLPPQRELADALGVNLTTVTRGYAEAERRGLVRGEVGRGTFVRPPAFAVADTAGLIDLSTNALLPQAHAAELASALASLVTRTNPERLFNYQPHAGRRRFFGARRCRPMSRTRS